MEGECPYSTRDGIYCSYYSQFINDPNYCSRCIIPKKPKRYWLEGVVGSPDGISGGYTVISKREISKEQVEMIRRLVE